jgi:hypothetical protein
MAPHVTILDASRHQAFLKQQRKDPVTKELLKPGDRIILCAGPGCGVAFLEESWWAIGGRHGQHTGALRDIEVAATPTRFGRTQQAAAAPPRQAQGNGLSAAPVENNAPAPRPEPGPLRLREIPFELREIPSSLRHVAEV